MATALGIVFALTSPAIGQDLIEFLSGAKAEGKVTAIDKEQRTVSFQTNIAGRSVDRTYPYDRLHAVTLNGKRYILNEMSSADQSSTRSGKEPAGETTRSRAEVEQLIADLGRTPPDWFDSTPLVFPDSLDLSWPEPAPQPWNNQRNIGQYIWDIVNPNPGRWREGVRLMHHLLTLHKEDPKLRRRAMVELGSMYFRFFQDYPRAAFWWRQAGVGKGDSNSVALAECYFRLGNRPMAVDMLNDRTLRLGMIKLWGDMGDTRKAAETAQRYVRAGGQPHEAYLLVGDAFRTAQKYDTALSWYQKVLDAPLPQQRREYAERMQRRASAHLEAIRLFELSDVARVADGTYRASSLGYEGPIEVAVSVKAGRIQDVKITQHREKQFYSALDDVPQQILEKQGVRGVDATSGATITAEAVINAAAKALHSGQSTSN